MRRKSECRYKGRIREFCALGSAYKTSGAGQGRGRGRRTKAGWYRFGQCTSALDEYFSGQQAGG